MGLVIVGLLLLLFLWWVLGRSSPSPSDPDSCPLDFVQKTMRLPAQDAAGVETPFPPPDDLIDPTIQPLVRALRSDVPFAAAAAATALGESKRPDAVKPLLEALKRDHRSVQFAAIEALLTLGPIAKTLVRDSRDKEPDPAQRQLLGTIDEQLEKQTRGEATLPVTEILPKSAKLIQELSTEIGR